MAGAMGASLLIVAALTVAMVSGLATAGIGLGPFANATTVRSVSGLESPALIPVDTSATPTADVSMSGAPAPLPQERRCPCP